MEGYLGSFPVDVKDTKFKDYMPINWAMYYIGSYGQIDGAHHKLWVLDQVARILKGTPIIVNEARWDNGHSEYRVTLGQPSKEYLDWVDSIRIDPETRDDYGYSEGIAP